MWKKRLTKLFVGTLVLGVLIQLVPYGRDHVNPKVTKEAPFTDPAAKALAQRACYDCHSNESSWPWYSHIAPVSWLVYRDVVVGRRHLNFSEWDRDQKGSATMSTAIEKGKMPFKPYLITHPEARLTEAETTALCKALDELPEPEETEEDQGAATKVGEAHKD